jgi:vacuolar-type H+-ATPase subunit H
MKKFLKISGISIVVLFILILVLPFLFKGKIIQLVKDQANEALNAKLEFSDLSLSLIRNFPSLSVKIENLSLSGIDEFEKDTLVAFNFFRTDLNLGSVLFGDQIEIKAVILDKPRVNAIVLHDGKANWDIMKPDTTAIEETDTIQEPSSFKIGLKKFAINQGIITYTDKQSNMSARIDTLDFLLKGDLSASKTTLDMETTIAQLHFTMDGIKYLRKAKISFRSELEADLDSSAYTFKDNEFKLNEIVLGFNGYIKMPTEDIAMDIKFNAKETAFKQVLSLIPEIYVTDFAGIETSGFFKFDGYAKGIYNDSILPAFGIDLKIENGMFKYPDLPKSVNNINVDVKVDNKGGSGDYNMVDIKKAHAEIAGNPIDASMFVSTTPADIDMKAKLNARLDFESILDLIPLDGVTLKGIFDADVDMAGKLSSLEKEKYNEFKADGSMGLAGFYYKGSELPEAVEIPEALIKFSPAFASLEKFDMKIGTSDFKLAGRIDNFLPFALQDSTLLANFNFNSNYLDVADLMSSTEEESIEESDTTSLTAFEIPGNIEFLLKSDLKHIKYDNLSITNLKGDIMLKDSKAMFKDVNMNLLEGSMGMNGSYDSKIIIEPKVDFDLRIKDFNIPAAFEAFNTVKQLAPIAKNTNGKFSIDFDFSSKLDYHLMPKYETLNGIGRFQSKDISITKSAALQKLAELTKWKKLENLSLKDVDLKFKIENGNMTIDPAKMKFGQTEMVFGGTQNLNKDMNYNIGFSIPRKELGEAVNNLVNNLIAKTGKDIQLAENIKMDIVLTGKPDDPKFKLKGSKDDESQGGIKEEIKQELKKELSKEALKIIEDADKQAQALIEKARQEADKLKSEAKNNGDKVIGEAEKQGQRLKDEADKKGQQLMAEADKKAQELVDKASNPITKAAAQKSGELLKKQARESADKLNTEADNTAIKLTKEVQEKAGKLNSETASKADEIVKKAENEADQIKQNAQNKVKNM